MKSMLLHDNPNRTRMLPPIPTGARVRGQVAG